MTRTDKWIQRAKHHRPYKRLGYYGEYIALLKEAKAKTMASDAITEYYS